MRSKHLPSLDETRATLGLDDAALARVGDAIVRTVAEFDPAKIRERVVAGHFGHKVALELSAADWAPLDLGHSSIVDAALDHHSEGYAAALRETGVPPSVVTLLMSWMTVQLEARDLWQRATAGWLLEQLAELEAPRTSGRED